jgi:hypothetical protein
MAVLTGGVNSRDRKNKDVLYLSLFKEHNGLVECCSYLCITRK